MDNLDIQHLKSQVDIVDVIGRYVELKKDGANYKGLCPFHDDDKASLIVSPSKQIFNCFACGGPTGKAGDAIDFLQGVGRNFKEAIEEIKGSPIDGSTNIKRKKLNKAPKWEFISNPPKETPIFNHYKYGEPNKYWTYKNELGDPIFYVCRFDLGGGEKQVLPHSYATNGDVSEWRWMGAKSPRPLYNLDLIKKYKNSTIIIVEGEKTADAAQSELPPHKTVVTTWVGGANGIHLSDWDILKGRKIIYWPDNDYLQKYGDKHPKAGEIKPFHEQAGNSAMLKIHAIIKPIIDIERWVKVPKGYPNKWDAADKEWKKNELRNFVLTNLIDVPQILLPENNETDDVLILESEETEIKNNEPKLNLPSDPKENQKLPESPKKIQSDPRDNEHYKMLGYDKDENGKLVYYFFSHDAKAVIKLSPSSMNKPNLMTIAPINYWEENFPSKTGVSTDAVQQFLIGQSHRVGIFKDDHIRGRGAWIDNDEIIIHCGNKILKDQKYIKLHDYKSKFVYEIGEDIGFKNVKPLKSEEAINVLKSFEWLKWERSVNAYLLAGWCVISPFCGVLNWRPHIWITGPSGSGKSYTMEKMIKPLLGGSAVVVQGKTTEAGVRGLLQSDARPVLFDESESESQNDKERIQSVLALARAASYSNGGGIAKGTKEGLSRTYTIRSCFAMSSIGMALNQRSDRSRFSVLSLMSFENTRSTDDFVKFDMEWSKLITNDFIDSLHARTISLLPVIIENSKTFADAASHIIGNRRLGDQLGAMLAGAYSLASKSKIDYETAIEWLNERDWNEEKGLEDVKDEYQLFNHIMGTELKVELDGVHVDRNIGELIQLSNSGYTGATDRLLRIGIKISDDTIQISNTASGIQRIVRNTVWQSNHNRILERLPNSQKITSRQFYPGHKSRSVAIPISMVIDSNYNEDEIEKTDEIPF